MSSHAGELSSSSQIRASSDLSPFSQKPDSHTIISTHVSLSQAVFERRAEYTQSNTTRVKIGSWNVGALSGPEKDIKAWFVDSTKLLETPSGQNLGEGDTGVSNACSGEDVGLQDHRRTSTESIVAHNDVSPLLRGNDIGLYVLGLQEIVDVSSITGAMRPYSDPNPARRWKRAVAEALPKGYTQVAEEQLSGLYLIIYASPLIAPIISSVSTTHVGTGALGVLGNKGAVAARIVLGETTRIVFINSHLTAGTEKGNLERRNWDVAQISSRVKFEPIYNGGGVMEEFGEGIGEEDVAFWFGDLNYRLEGIPGDDVRRLLRVHTQKQYEDGQASEKKIQSEPSEQTSSLSTLDREFVDDSSEDDRSSSHTATSKSVQPVTSSFTLSIPESVDAASDPTSIQTTISSLLRHDELHTQIRTRKVFFDGWREGHIGFLPTYKYDIGSAHEFDSSEKQRVPSFCDRIWYRTRKDRLEFSKVVEAEQKASRRDEEMRKREIDGSHIEDEAVLFDYDPDTDGAQNEYDSQEDDSKHSELLVTKSGFEDKLHQEYYTSHQCVLSSDHKPVESVFTLDYDAVDSDLRTKVYQEVARELDKAENEGRPSVTVVTDPHNDADYDFKRRTESLKFEGVDFGEVRYDQEKSRNIAVANTGRVSATVGFVNRSAEQGELGGVAPPWLGIEFDRACNKDTADSNVLKEYTLEPGDAIKVELIIHVTDIGQVGRLNKDDENLEDVLVFRIHNGRDYFLPVRGTWLHSSFGRSVDDLIQIPEGGARKLQHRRPMDGAPGDEGVTWSAPRELFRLTESIEKLIERSIAEWGMKGEQGKPPWKEVGWPFTAWTGDERERQQLKQSVREGLDTDNDFTAHFPPDTSSVLRLEVIAETLLAFVSSLDGGLITPDMWTAIEHRTAENERARAKPSGEEERAWILEVLSSAPAHSISFTFIIFMLSRVAHELVPVKRLPETPRFSKESSREKLQSIAPNPDTLLRVVRRQEVDAAFAALFADAMIRAPAISRDRERRVSEARRRAVVEVFLRGNWEAESV